MPQPSSPLPDPAPAATAVGAVARRLVLVNLMAVATLPAWGAQAPRPVEGGDTPQAVVAAMQQAATVNDWGSAFALLLPSRRHELAEPLVEGVLLMVAMADPDSPIAGDLPGAEKAKRRKAYTAAATGLRQAWRPFGLDGVIGKAPLAPETRQAVATALPKADLVVMMRDTMAVFDGAAAALGIAAESRPRVPEIRDVTGYAVRGDRATAKEGKAPIDFARVGGRWYLAPPKTK